MDRIVHGHYTDPNSTRDIVGITPEEFECLIKTLQEKCMGIESIIALDEIERFSFVKNIVLTQYQDEIDDDFLKEQINKKLNSYENDYCILHNFLTAINQPYPGAIYFPPQ